MDGSSAVDLQDGSPVQAAHDRSGVIRLLWVFSTFAVGGPQRRMATLTKSLGLGYEHFVFAMDGRYDAEAILPEGLAYERVEAPVKKGGFISLANIRQFRACIRDVENRRSKKPDSMSKRSGCVLLTSNWGAIEWLFANRGRAAIPHIHFEDGFGPDERPDAQNRKRVLMRKFAFKKRGLEFVAPSHVLADVYKSAWGVDPARVHLIPNGVDCEQFSAAARPVRPVTIGTIAALRPEKRLDRLISCFSSISDTSTRLLIVGDGPERAALEAQAAPLGDRVIFAGEQGNVAPFLADIDIYALSSDTEQMPISLVEAMASGLPVAATNVGDVSRMVAAPNRPHVISLGDDAALTRTLAALSADSAVRASLGEANREQALAEYDLAAMTARYDAILRRIAKG